MLDLVEGLYNLDEIEQRKEKIPFLKLNGKIYHFMKGRNCVSLMKEVYKTWSEILKLLFKEDRITDQEDKTDLVEIQDEIFRKCQRIITLMSDIPADLCYSIGSARMVEFIQDFFALAQDPEFLTKKMLIKLAEEYIDIYKKKEKTDEDQKKLRRFKEAFYNYKDLIFESANIEAFDHDTYEELLKKDEDNIIFQICEMIKKKIQILMNQIQ